MTDESVRGIRREKNLWLEGGRDSGNTGLTETQEGSAEQFVLLERTSRWTRRLIREHDSRFISPRQSPEGQTHAQSPRAIAQKEVEHALTILLVDDEPSLRAALTEYLRGVGHRVLDSQTTHDALELARSHEGSIEAISFGDVGRTA
jgi:hypothetical protein